eukprot:2468631-Rhodomonas_salina.1
MAPGRKKKQLLAAITHMLRDVMATRRSPARTQTRCSPQRYGVIMCRPSTSLILLLQQTSPASASASHGFDPGLCDVLSLPAQQPSLGATNFVLWLQTLDTAGIRWGGLALWSEDSSCTAVLHMADRLPTYSVPALRDALPSLDTVLLPTLCLALGTPPTATLFLCRSFRHDRALKSALQFDLDF